MKKYICTVCEYIYDPEQGDPESGIEPGTAFEDIPDDWTCPYAESAKKILNRTKDKPRERELFKRRMAGCIDICPVFFVFLEDDLN